MNLNVRHLNPVFDRELRQRSRSRRSMLMMTLFLLLLVGVLFVVYKGSESSAQFNFDPISALTVRVGRTMFEWVLAAELVVLLFIVPGVSASAVSGERDRQTLIPLQVTLIGPLGIFFGKVASSSAFVLLLVIAALPVLTVPYLVGGISLTNVVLSVITLLLLGVMLAMIGVSCSAIFKRTQTATLAAYGVVLTLVFGTLIALAVLSIIDSSRGDDEVDPPLAALYPNPFIAIADAAGDIGSPGDGPFTPIKQEFIRSQAGDNVFFNGNVPIDGDTGEVVDLDGLGGGVPLWIRSLLSIFVPSALLSVVAVRRLRAPHRRMSQ